MATYQDANKRLRDTYAQALGPDRAVSDVEINSHLDGGRNFQEPNIQHAIANILGSPEATAYKAAQQTPAGTPTAPTAPPPATAPQGAGWQGMNLGFGGQQNSAAFEGFNDERALAGGDPDSVKDLFRRFIGSQQFSGDSSKEGLDSWLTGLMPQARSQGLNILDVIGDQALIETKERGPEWIDYYRNAGGEGGAFQWLPQLDVTGQQPDAAMGGALNSLRGQPGGADILAALMANGGLQGQTLLEQIQAELQKILTGKPVTTPNLPVPGGGGGGGTSPQPEY